MPGLSEFHLPLEEDPRPEDFPAEFLPFGEDELRLDPEALDLLPFPDERLEPDWDEFLSPDLLLPEEALPRPPETEPSELPREEVNCPSPYLTLPRSASREPREDIRSRPLSEFALAEFLLLPPREDRERASDRLHIDSYFTVLNTIVAGIEIYSLRCWLDLCDVVV